MHFDHVALVLPALEPCLRALADAGLPVGAVDEFEAENTREAYVLASSPRILLMQPLSARGPLARAFARRGGPGFHHLAFHGAGVREAIARARGWEVCRATEASLARGGAAWLLRREAGLLLELQPDDAAAAPSPGALREVLVELDADLPFPAPPPLRVVPGRGGVVHLDLEAPGGPLRLLPDGTLRAR